MEWITSHWWLFISSFILGFVGDFIFFVLFAHEQGELSRYRGNVVNSLMYLVITFLFAFITFFSSLGIVLVIAGWVIDYIKK